MLRPLILSGALILILVSASSVCSQADTSKHKPYALAGAGLHGGVGWSFFGKGTNIKYDRWVFMPNAGVHARWFFSPKVSLYQSLDYLSVGAKLKTPYSIDELRVRTIQLSNYVDVFLMKNHAKPALSIRGGFFVGRILNSVHYWERLDLDVKGKETPNFAFGNWNGGLTVGTELIQKVKSGNHISASLYYDLGITNVLAANLPEGVNTYTRAYRITLSYTYQ